jgi:hypothetical protein
MSDHDERRRFTRVRFDTAATLAQRDSVFHTHVMDISLNGVLLETPENYKIDANQPANVVIFLNETTDIHMTVSLAHSTNRYLGFHCESIDVDSISHLRRLIELNTDLPNASERILDELIAPHQ